MVPRTVTDVNKMVCLQVGSQILGRFEEEGEQFLKSLVSTDVLPKRWKKCMEVNGDYFEE